MTLSLKATLLVVVPLVFNLIFVGTLIKMLHDVDAERAREAHAREYTAHLNTVLRLLLERGVSNTIAHITKSEAFWSRSRRIHQELLAEEAIIPRLAETPHERVFYERFNGLMTRCNQIIAEANEASLEGDKAALGLRWMQMNNVMDQICTTVENAVDEQQKSQKLNKDRQVEMRKQIEFVLYAGIALNIFMALAMVSFFNMGTSRRLKILMKNTVNLSMGRSLEKPLAGRDELAELDKTFRVMSRSLNQSRHHEMMMLDLAADVICELDDAGRISRINPACLKQWGYGAEDLVGKYIKAIIAVSDQELLSKNIEAAHRGDVSFTCNLITASGKSIVTEWSMHWSDDEQSAFCVVHDVSQRANLERMKSDFLAMASHDIRVPLSSLVMLHKMLLKGKYGQLSPEAVNRLEQAQGNTERLLALVERLLSVEALESGQFNLECEPVAISDIVGSALALVENYAAERKVDLIAPPQSALSSELKCDGAKMTQVVFNLLTNAVKFSPAGAAVQVGVTSELGYTSISVTDQGPGVAADKQAAIFDRFKTFGADSQKNGGTGLGLAICKLIVEKHNGTISVDSRPGAATTFAVRLPG